MAETKLVRIKPHNPKIGHVLRRYTWRGMRFDEERGWYRVDARVAEHLATVHSRVGDENSPLAFDVCTEVEAAALDKREYDAKVREGRMAPGEALPTSTLPPRDISERGDLTTEDLARGTSRERASAPPPRGTPKPRGRANV